MAELTSIEEIKRHKRKKTLLRRFILFMVVLVLVVGGIYIVSSPHVWDFFSRLGGKSSFPVSVVGADIQQVAGVRNRIVLLNETSVLVYDLNGNEKKNFQHRCSAPCLKTAGKYSLIYDSSGRTATVYCDFEEQYSHTFGYTLLDAAVSENGILVAATGSEEYVSEVRAYDSENHLFTWSSAKNRVLSVAVSPNGKNIAVVCVDADGGELVSTLLLFDIGKTKEQARFELRSELILSAEYRSSGELCVVAENETFVVKNNEIVARFDYGGEKLSAYENSMDGHIALFLGSYTEKKSLDLVMLDMQCKQTGTSVVSEEILGLDASGDLLSLHVRDGFLFYGGAAVLTGSCEAPDAISFAQEGDAVFYTTNRTLQKAVQQPKEQ